MRVFKAVVRAVVRAVVGAAMCGLAGCTDGTGAFAPDRNAEVLGGAFLVAPPRGYCIDRTAGQETADSAVVLMGRCSDAAPVPPAVLTLTVAEAGSAAVLASGGRALADYFTSSSGRAAVSRSGRASDVEVIEAFGLGDAFLLHLSDRRIGPYWRAVLGARGRLVTLSVTPPGEGTLPPESARAVLEEALAGVQRANRPIR